MASLTQILRKAHKVARKIDPLGSKILEKTKDLPGSPGSFMAAIEDKKATSSDIYGRERSRFDIFAGGERLSRNPDARTVGRAVGTVAALYFGGKAFGGGAETGTAGTTGGAATTGSAAGGTGAAASKGILGTGVSTETAVVAGLTAQSVVEQKKAAKAAEEAMRQQGEAFDESLTRLRRDTPQTPTIDEARRRAEQSDAMRRRRGRRASILTGDTGVGFTPVSQRTLIGT